jgi:low affinity Fe/Cu permease
MWCATEKLSTRTIVYIIQQALSLPIQIRADLVAIKARVCHTIINMDAKLQKLKILVVRHHKDDSIKKTATQKSDVFHKVSVKIANKLGSAWAFYIALLLIVVWATSGPLFNFSDTWQLVINTSTTIVTFLMVFVIQNTQNRDGRAMQIKLDELLNATRSARTEFIDIEDLSDAELDELQEQFRHTKAKITKKR